MPTTVPGEAAVAQAASDETLTLNFPENTHFKALIEYVSQRLGIQFLYDDQIGETAITIKQGVQIPRSTLLNFLQVILQSKGYAIADLNQAGWKQITPAAQLPQTARPLIGATTRPVEGAVTQVFVTQSVDASRIEVLIKPFLSQPGGTTASIAERRLLVVTDYAANVARIASLIEEIDQPVRQVVIEFVQLKNADASDVSTRTQTIMQSTVNTAGAQSPTQIGMVEVGFDARTNQIALVGPKERVAEAINVVKQFDAPVALVTQTYHFDYASPDRVDKLMKQLLDPAVAKRAYQSAVDKEGRLLVVSTTPEIHARIEAMKTTVDVQMPITDSPIQFYKLSNTSAKDVLKTLKGIQGQDDTDSYDALEHGDGDRGAANPLSRRKFNGGIPGSDYGQGANQQGASQSGDSSQMGSSPRFGVGARFGASTQPNNSGHVATDSTGRVSFQTDNAIITADVNTNSIIVLAEPAVQKVYEQLIRTLDKRRPQVLIECTLVTLDTSSDFTLGVDIGIHGSIGSSKIVTFSSFGVGVPQTVSGAGSAASGRVALVPGAAGFNGALISSDIADIVVHALSTSSRAKVISAPKILVNDNATGSLMSIAEQPYTNTNIGNTISTTSFGGYAEAGTTIELTPHISEADYLQLEYDVSLNQFSGRGADGIPPPRQTNSLSSTVTIPDGSTIIIGGLDASNVSETVNAVPILGEIPIIKYLFSSRDRTRHDSTLFVFIRPIILRDDQFKDLQYLSDRDTKSAGLSPDDPVSEPLTIR
ncbi:MAG: ral secretion pathway protein GspD [Phycisphaerales bacterium]|nr:ral secretion pathway protein GspD [Phycisphaerales bacterium]